MKSRLANFYRLVNSNNDSSRRNRTLYFVIFALILLSIFTTIIGQLPSFSSRGITQIFQIPWLFLIIPIILFSYKLFLNNLIRILFILVPFAFYLLISFFLGIQSFSFRGTVLVFLCMFIFLIGSSLIHNINTFQLKCFALSYLLSVLIYAAVIYFDKLRGVDISGSIYALGTKNSTGPILIIGLLCSFYVFDKNNFFCIFLNIIVSIALITLVGLMKCRTVLISLPFLLCFVVLYRIKNVFLKIGIFGFSVLIILIVIFVPSINQVVVYDILFNGKTNIDDIFSGRISQTIKAFETFKPIFGNGNTYIDCMPLCFLLSYGIFGYLCLLPFSIIPIVNFISVLSGNKNNSSRLFLVGLLVLFFFQYLFEGFGYFGPGAKSFIFWFVGGVSSKGIFENSKSYLFRKVSSTSTFISNNIKPIWFLSFVEIAMVFLTVMLFSSNNVLSKIGETIYEKIPSNTVITTYNSPTNVKLRDDNLKQLCVGQKITYYFESDNKDCEEVVAVIKEYGQGYPGHILVDSNSNTITVFSAGYYAYGFSIMRENVTNPWGYISTCSSKKYQFDNITISGQVYKKSFEHTNNEEYTIGVDSNMIIYKDTFYIPDNVDFSFKSSDESVAKVDSSSGLVTGINEGECFIYGIVKNDQGVFESKNKIFINVSDDNFTKCTSLELDCDDKCYQFIPFSINSIFNSGASNTNCIYEITGLNYELNNNVITFLEPGIATIIVTSISNHFLSKTMCLNVEENRPISFSSSTKNIQVGQKYGPSDLGLMLNFSSGHSLFVSDDVLSFSGSDFSNRAWHETNGMINDHCSIMAVKTGVAHLDVVCKYDENVRSTFYYDVIKYSNETYQRILAMISTIIIMMVSIITIVFAIFINFKKRYFKSIVIGALAVLYSVLCIFFVGINLSLLVVCLLYMIVAVALILLNQFVFCDNWPNILTNFVPLSPKKSEALESNSNDE